MKNYQNAIEKYFSFPEHQFFWSLHPAVLLAISFLVGIETALFSFPIYLTLIFALYTASLKKWTALLSIALSALYSLALYGSAPQISNLSRAYFSISSIQPHQTPFHSNFLYKGTLYIGSSALPCSISVQKGNRVPADCDYVLTGTLSERNPYDYTFKPKTWEKVPNTFSFAQIRYEAKSGLRKYLFARLKNPRSAKLLASLSTGEVDDRMLRFEFGKLGLQHILAISGFHFGVLIAFIALLLKFLPYRPQWIAMILLTSTYYLFIGDSPAVQRAYITALLFLIAKLIRRPANSINLLGTAFLIELILNPLNVSNLGFQFSFGSCFGILLFFKPLETYLRKFLPSRPAQKSSHLPLFEGIAYLISSAFRNALSLTLSVNIALLPLLFHHFGQFPLLSLLYNLFFPFLITIDLFSLLGAILLSGFIPSLTKPLFYLLNLYTTEILDLISYPPLPLQYSIYLQKIPLELIPIYLFALLCLAIKIKFCTCNNNY